MLVIVLKSIVTIPINATSSTSTTMGDLLKLRVARRQHCAIRFFAVKDMPYLSLLYKRAVKHITMTFQSNLWNVFVWKCERKAYCSLYFLQNEAFIVKTWQFQFLLIVFLSSWGKEKWNQASSDTHSSSLRLGHLRILGKIHAEQILLHCNSKTFLSARWTLKSPKSAGWWKLSAPKRKQPVSISFDGQFSSR